ncbi:MAG: exonuclease domain-containing protein [Bacteroidota bacterium]
MKTRPKQYIDETDFTILDVETTGLSPNTGDRICEIAAVKIRGGAVIKSFGTLINPCRPISAGAYQVNRISPEMVRDAPMFQEIAEDISSLLKDSVIGAYNTPFDMGFIKNEFSLAGCSPVKNSTLDVLVLARQLIPGLEKYSQEFVASALGIAFPVKHRAMEDVMITAKLFLTFTSILKAYDLRQVSDLQRSDLLNHLNNHRLKVIEAAISTGGKMWLRYLSPTQADMTESIITPKDIVREAGSRKENVHLFAYCHTSKFEKKFLVDRILDMRLLTENRI